MKCPKFQRNRSARCCVIMPQFDPAEVLRLAQKHAIETIKLIPTMLQRILRVPGVEKVKLPAMRAMIYGASPMPNEPLRQAIEIFGPEKLVQIYGQSECPVTLTILTADEHRLDNPHPDRLTSAGRPWTGVEIRIEDDQGKPDVSATMARKLVDAGAVFIMSISLTPATRSRSAITSFVSGLPFSSRVAISFLIQSPTTLGRPVLPLPRSRSGAFLRAPTRQPHL